jgi:pimeloyl-ACP methyl ester carboxylesterase
MHDEARLWLPAVLRQTGIRRPILVGHSDGASIALLYASRVPVGAPRPLGLVLLAPHVFVEEVTVRAIRALAEEPARSRMLRRLRRRHGRKARRLFEAWTGVWLRPNFRSWSIAQDVARVKRPLLVVQGTEDEFGTLAQVEAVRSRSKAPVESRILEGCGHVLHRDRSAQTLAATAAFARRLLKAEAPVGTSARG